MQRASGYAIDGPFILLVLLERNPERVGERSLRQARFLSPQPQSRNDLAINDVGKTFDMERTSSDRAP